MSYSHINIPILFSKKSNFMSLWLQLYSDAFLQKTTKRKNKQLAFQIKWRCSKYIDEHGEPPWPHKKGPSCTVSIFLSHSILSHLVSSYLILSAWAPKALAAERSLQHSYVLSNVWRATRDLRGVQPWRKSLGLLWPSPLGFCSIVSSQGPLTQGPVRQLGTYASTEVDLVLWTSLIFLCTLP